MNDRTVLGSERADELLGLAFAIALWTLAGVLALVTFARLFDLLNH